MADHDSSGVRALILLQPLRQYSDFALLLLRVLVGTFLIWGVTDNILSVERMHEFAEFLDRYGFPAPLAMAQLSVWAQFITGVAFVIGGLTRWAGALCAVNFAVALIMVDSLGGIRGAFPSATLIALGLYFATHGAGRFGVDRLWEAPRREGHGATRLEAEY